MLKDKWEEKHSAHGFSDNQPSSSIIEPVSFRHPLNNQNHVSETQPIIDAEKYIADSNMQELIKFLSANYGPMKTPLELGTPEYLKLVEILQQNNDRGEESYSKTGDESSRNNQEKLVKNDSKKLPCEKLWEGTLQLSSSVTLSAIAFFKSGEKLVGNTWPESIQVKGKVRLEAFEKYVKDLPRSRNRGLMVISVCWKEGSSDTGLTGMKEVAKGYKKSSRVGFAQLLSGIDLYICPRSDPIITILAKYGFFKGMSVLDDKQQDSMIGCVVWRKNRPLNPVNTETTPDSSTLSIQHDEQPPLTLPLTTNLETSKNDVDPNPNPNPNGVNSTSDSCDLVVKKRAFQDDDDLPEFDFGQKLDNSQLDKRNNNTGNNASSIEQSSKKVKLFDDNDDDMPEWCPPAPTPTVVHRQLPPQNFQNLPRPPPVPIPPPPRPDTRPSFSYQPFRPPIASPPPPTFMRPPPLPPRLPPPPPPPPQQQPGGFNSNEAMWHWPGSSNGNPLLVSFNTRPPHP